MQKEERYEAVTDWFARHAPAAETELRYADTFQLLVAVILSAQCTDKRVNIITPPLFDAFPTAEAMAAASTDAIYHYIRSVSYPNNKARHLVAMARMLVTEFEGRVPPSTDELQRLPGVGRKTANVIASVAFNQPAMAVDTHVFRVSNRIGLTDNSPSPLATERELVRYIPRQILSKAHHWLILHGRYVCTARKPRCEACGLTAWCKYYGAE
jgi:endonuclease-3